MASFHILTSHSPFWSFSFFFFFLSNFFKTRFKRRKLTLTKAVQIASAPLFSKWSQPILTYDLFCNYFKTHFKGRKLTLTKAMLIASAPLFSKWPQPMLTYNFFVLLHISLKDESLLWLKQCKSHHLHFSWNGHSPFWRTFFCCNYFKTHFFKGRKLAYFD